MAGHSKWNNIKNRKGAQDAKRGKIFQRLSREIYMAAKAGSDPDMNATLRLAIDKAKAENMPNDNIDRAIKRATETGDTTNYDEMLYEAYGPGGVGILAYALTDNHNRTSTNVRVAITHNGGTMAERGSVSFQFDRKGYIVIEREKLSEDQNDEESLLLMALEAGADDILINEEVAEIYTQPSHLAATRDSIKDEGYPITTAELIMDPKVTIPVSENDQKTLENILEALDNDDDVSDIYHNAAI